MAAVGQCGHYYYYYTTEIHHSPLGFFAGVKVVSDHVQNAENGGQNLPIQKWQTKAETTKPPFWSTGEGRKNGDVHDHQMHS